MASTCSWASRRGQSPRIVLGLDARLAAVEPAEGARHAEATTRTGAPEVRLPPPPTPLPSPAGRKAKTRPFVLIEVLEIGRRANVIHGELDQLIRGQVAAAGVAEQDVDAAVPSPLQPRQDATGKVSVVPAVAGQDDVDLWRLLVEDISTHDRHPRAVGARVELDGCRGEDVDIGSGRLGRAGTHRRDRAQPGARSDIEHPPAGHSLRVLAQVPADREPARPGERPVRQGRVRIIRLDLDGMPERQDIVSQLEPDLLEPRDRSKAGVAQDEATGEAAMAGLYASLDRADATFSLQAVED